MAADILTLSTPTCYWNDEAQGDDARDHKDLLPTPAGVATTRTVAADAAHLARLLRSAKYPPV